MADVRRIETEQYYEDAFSRVLEARLNSTAWVVLAVDMSTPADELSIKVEIGRGLTPENARLLLERTLEVL